VQGKAGNLLQQNGGPA